MAQAQNILLRQGSCEISSEDLAYIHRFIARFPGLTRYELVCTLCEHLDWVTPAGSPKYPAGHALLAQLERAGEIVLPARVKSAQNTIGKHWRCRPNAQVSAGRLLRCSLSELAPVRLRFLNEADEQDLFNAYLERFHPLGYRRPFGFFARYFIEAADQCLGCVLVAGAARAIAARDQRIGWSVEQRRRNLPWVVNNSRFLIFPWVEVAHLASHVLGQLARQLADDWQRRWEFRPLLLETFVDPVHYRGSCYRGAGWELLGRTSGQGLARPGKHYRSSPKLIFVKPLHRQWRQSLCSDKRQQRGQR